jgi:hypothetical protein
MRALLQTCSPLFAALAGASLALATPSLAQAKSSRFDPLETFAPLTLPQPPNVYRGGNGAPGPSYWQNRADYVLRAHLLPDQHVLKATAVITYTNNSPTPLEVLWLQLDQNVYRRDSRSHLAIPRHRPHRPDEPSQEEPYTDGFIFESVTLTQGGRPQPADTRVSDTRMRILLPKPLPPHGKVQLRLSGTRGWRSTTTSAAGTRSRTSAASSIWSTAASNTR